MWLFLRWSRSLPVARARAVMTRSAVDATAPVRAQPDRQWLLPVPSAQLGKAASACVHGPRDGMYAWDAARWHADATPR